MPTLTQQGIEALKQGKKAEAKTFLDQAVIQNPKDVQAWLWLSGAADSDQERLNCLQRVLAIDPDNSAAASGLAKLAAKGAIQAQPTAAGTIPQRAKKPIARNSHVQEVGGERNIFNTKPSITPFVMALILCSFLFVFLIWMIATQSYSGVINSILALAAIVIFGSLYWKLGVAFIKSLFANYTLTTRHLIVKTGVLSRNQKTIPIHKIQDVSTQQVFLLRPFGVGNVIVESAGERGEIKLFALAHCQKRSRQILQVVDRYR